MREVATLILSLAVILHPIECGSQFKRSSTYDPNSDDTPRGPSFRPNGCFPDTTLSLAPPYYSPRSTSIAERSPCVRHRSPPVRSSLSLGMRRSPLARSRSSHATSRVPSVPPPRVETHLHSGSRSPLLQQPFPRLLGYKFEELGFIRLIPRNNPFRRYVFRRYVFPRDRRILSRAQNNCLRSMPAGEQIVLSRFNGDVCAVLVKLSNKQSALRGLFNPNTMRRFGRAKINMNSGDVGDLTAEEIADCPVGTSIAGNFIVFRV